MPTTDPIAAEIEAEIRDHLATAAERLEQQGLEPAKAEQRSIEKFGDVAAIGRRCYWIKQGETLMFRSAVVLLLIALAIGLATTVAVSWHTQSRLADQMTALAEQLKALAEQQKSPPVAPELAPLEVTGKVYLGSSDKPAASTEVMICRASDGAIIRRVSTSQNGTYRSGPLTAGDYTLVAKGVEGAPSNRTGVQSAPIYLYPGVFPRPNLDIDASYRSGRLAIEISRPLPKVEIENKYTIDSRLHLRVLTTVWRPTRWTAASPMPAAWPIYIDSPDRAIGSSVPSRGVFGPRGAGWTTESLLSNDDLEKGPMKGIFPEDRVGIPAGPCAVAIAVVADVIPHDLYAEQLMSAESLYTRPPGTIWWAKLQGIPDIPNPNVGSYGASGGLPTLRGLSTFLPSFDSPIAARVTIADGKATRLRIEIPAGFETRIQNLVDSITNPDEFEKAVMADVPFIREAKTTSLGTEPLQEVPQP